MAEPTFNFSALQQRVQRFLLATQGLPSLTNFLIDEAREILEQLPAVLQIAERDRDDKERVSSQLHEWVTGYHTACNERDDLQKKFQELQQAYAQLLEEKRSLGTLLKSCRSDESDPVEF